MSVGVLPAPVAAHHLSAVPTEARASGLELTWVLGSNPVPWRSSWCSQPLCCLSSPLEVFVFVFKPWLAWKLYVDQSGFDFPRSGLKGMYLEVLV